MMSRLFLLLPALALLACTGASDDTGRYFETPLGKRFLISEPSEKAQELLEVAKADYREDSSDIENIIWYGRRIAYTQQYDEAIDVYTQGIGRYPDNPRLYRHRGHRYISIRQYDKAIDDLETAARLIEGASNMVEQDGMPNAQNIPVSTLNGNIWYHLGLAYYLTHQYEKAFDAYLKCRDSGNRYDNIVSSTHWLYMIQRRMGNTQLADSMLAPITLDSTVIENHSYMELCNLYKGFSDIKDFESKKEDSPSNDAIRYGLANWYFYNGQKDRAEMLMREITEGTSWSSFGYLAAESDLIEQF